MATNKVYLVYLPQNNRSQWAGRGLVFLNEKDAVDFTNYLQNISGDEKHSYQKIVIADSYKDALDMILKNEDLAIVRNVPCP